ncbi:MAG: hypothetical protein OXC28_01020 [Defluviicoccus sp.]|nr:hypothetical protein [Defluviicoccus sp.]
MPFAQYLVDIAICLRRLTWLKLPGDAAEEGRPFAESCWAYPVVGAGIGGAAAVAFLAADELGLAPSVAAVVALAASLAVTGAAPERALARVAGSLVASSAAEWNAIVLALAVVLKAAAIAQAAHAGPVGGILIGTAAIAYACQIAALHAAPDGEGDVDSDAKPALGPVGIALGVGAAISLIVMAEGWLAAVILAGVATGGIVYAARRPGAAAAAAALPAVLALAEILALLAVVASR